MSEHQHLDELIKQPSVEIEEQEQVLSPRSRARHAAMQALYQWQINTSELYIIEKQFLEDGLLSNVDREWFRELLHQVSAQIEELDAIYAGFLDRSVKLINPVERTILRMATYELQTQMQIPYKVVINEAVEMSKRFGAEEAHKYINGVLDKVARQLRPIEFSA